MYHVTGGKVNPLIGSAGVSAVPMAARVSQVVGQKENPKNFLLMHAIPGGPFTAEKSLPPAVKANIEARYKLNDPLLTQYKDYLANVIRGDLGPSFKYVGRSVNDIIAESFPVSLELGLESIFLAMLVGVPAGVLAAYRRSRWPDRAVNLLTTLGVAVRARIRE